MDPSRNVDNAKRPSSTGNLVDYVAAIGPGNRFYEAVCKQVQAGKESASTEEAASLVDLSLEYEADYICRYPEEDKPDLQLSPLLYVARVINSG